MTAASRRTTRPHAALQLSAEETDLESLFTDSEEARKLFEAMLTAERPTRRLLVVHGLGGVGKSSLLKMYRLSCRRKGIPVALSEAQDALSVAALLADWTEDLANDRVKLPAFTATLNQYRAIKARVEAEARNSGSVMGQLGRMGAAASPKVAMTATAASHSSNDVGNIDASDSNVAVGSGINQIGTFVAQQVVVANPGAMPFISPFAAAVGSGGAEAFMDWLRSFLPAQELELYLDPTKPLANDFGQDLAKAAKKQRIVLMVDTYEQMTTLDEWMCDFARRLPENVLLVMSGRAVPNWDAMWDAWMGRAQLVEQKEMTPEYLRELVNRRYAHIHGGQPDPQQVEAVVQFARGLPMVAATVVQLWVKHGVEDFHAVRPQVVEDLVRSLLRGVPKEMRPAFEVAAALRYFNADSLGALLDGGDAEAMYEELQRWPFIRGRREGLAVHDTMREMINEALKSHSPRRYCALHEKAAAYYESRIAKASGDEQQRLIRERLYHLVCADEEAGIKLFQQMAEELRLYTMVNRLYTLLNDVSNYPLERENSKAWWNYYSAYLLQRRGQPVVAERMYLSISTNLQIEAKLRAYAFYDLGVIWTGFPFLGQPGGVERALDAFERARRLAPQDDLRIARTSSPISDVYIYTGEVEKAKYHLEHQLHTLQNTGDEYSIVSTLNRLRSFYAVTGDLRMYITVMDARSQLVESVQEGSLLRTQVARPHIWSINGFGRYYEYEEAIKGIISYDQQMDDQFALASDLRDLGLILGLQGKYREAEICFTKSLEITKDEDGSAFAWSFWGVILSKKGDLGRASEYLDRGLSDRKLYLDTVTVITMIDWLGQLYEAKSKHGENPAVELNSAEETYKQALDYRYTHRRYWICTALTGLVRVKHAQGNYEAIEPLQDEAEQLAQQYEYNDHLASLRLTQGHIAWDGGSFEDALGSYKQALTYALRYNRFMLDEVLWGGGICTPLQPLIPYVMGRPDEGRRLLTALRDWWLTGSNDIGTPRPDTISPIHEGTRLLEGERLARDREPGDGSPQSSVIEKIEAALA